jgi:hypothetical protein
MRWKKKRKSTPVVFGNTVDDEAILRQKQIEEPEGEVDFSFLSGRTTTPSGIRPTGKRSLGVSGAYAPLDHEHPTALLLTSNTQSPEQRELRIDNANFLRIWDGNQWVLVEPTASNQAPLLTGTQNVGTSLKYSREDHTHPTGLLQVSNTQTPITGEIRYDSEGIKRYDGTNWILIADLTTSLDWSNITNKPTEFPVSVRKNSAAPVHTRPRLNFIEGSNITITVADDTTDNEVDITISSTGGGGSGDAYSTVSDGTNTASATGQEVLRFISPDGTVNIQVVAGSPDEVRFTVGSHTHPLSQIQQSGAQTGQRPQWNGSQWVPSAVDWAEIVNKPSAFPPSTHTHPLSQLEQSGAQTGQVVQWDGSQWAASDVGWSEIANKPTRFPVAVRKNSGGTDVVRPRINLIEGSNISITVDDDSGDDEIDITISSTGGSGGGNAYSTVSDGTNTASATGEETLQFYSIDGTVRIQVVSGSPDRINLRATPVRETASYSAVGITEGEIWYRGTDRAFFFRVGGSRVYPVAHLPSTSEVPSGTGAGNRILAMGSGDRRLFEMGSNAQAPLWANAVAWHSTTAPSSSEAGTTLSGKMWFHTSTKRLTVYDGSASIWLKPITTTDEVVQEGDGANATSGLSVGRLFSTAQGLMYAAGSGSTVFQVPNTQGVFHPPSALIRGTATSLTTANLNFQEFGGFITPIQVPQSVGNDTNPSITNDILVVHGFFFLPYNHTIRFLFDLCYQVSGSLPLSNPPELGLEVRFTKIDEHNPVQNRVWRAYFVNRTDFTVASSPITRRSRWLGVFNTQSIFTLLVNGVSQGVVPMDTNTRYLVSFIVSRYQTSETSPRRTVLYTGAYSQVYNEFSNKERY